MAAAADQRHFRIKAAQRDLIAAAGGIERAGELTNFGKSHVGRWNNAGDPDLMPLQAVLILEAECCMPLVTSAMAALNNRRLADPEAEAEIALCVSRSFSDVVRQVGELMAAGTLAFSDGKMSPAEANENDKIAALLEQKLAEHRKALAKVRAAGGFSVIAGGAA